MSDENSQLQIQILALNKIIFEMLKRYCGGLEPDENVGI